jgi:hypothetical protein
VKSHTPNGEPRPTYDAETVDGVDIDAIHSWAVAHGGLGWSMERTAEDRRTVAAILWAAGATGHTIISRATADVLARDAKDLESIRAWWTNHDPGTLLGGYGGDPVAATLGTLTECDERH